MQTITHSGANRRQQQQSQQMHGTFTTAHNSINHPNNTPRPDKTSHTPQASFNTNAPPTNQSYHPQDYLTNRRPTNKWRQPQRNLQVVMLFTKHCRHLARSASNRDSATNSYLSLHISLTTKKRYWNYSYYHLSRNQTILLQKKALPIDYTSRSRPTYQNLENAKTN